MTIEDRPLRIEHFTGSEVVKPEPEWILLSDIEPQYKQLFYWGADNPKVESLSKPLSKYSNAWYFICTDGYEGLKWCDANSYDKAFSEYQYLQKRYDGWGKIEEEDEIAFLKGEYVLTFHEWGISLWHPKTINLSSEKLSIPTFESILKDHGI